MSAAGHPRSTGGAASLHNWAVRFLFSDLPRWLLLLALFYAPWAFGCTQQWAIWGLDILLGTTLALWLAGLLSVRRRWSAIPPRLGITAGLLLVLGWWMVVNSQFVWDADYLVFVTLPHVTSVLPGSIDRSLSLDWMWRTTTLLGTALFVAAEIGTRPVWLLRLWRTLGLTAGSMALLGLLQKATGAENIFWLPPRPPSERVSTFFASYYYHANAGAFLNLVLPPTVGLLLRVMARHRSAAERALWLSVVLLLVMAVLSNTSRAAQALAALLGCVLFLGPIRNVLSVTARNVGWRRTAAAFALILLVLFAFGQASELDRPLKRWRGLSESVEKDNRWPAAQAGMGGLRSAGWFGLGPGTFPAVFPYLTERFGFELRGVWLTLHQDYIQTVLEWGWLGAALWSVLFFGGIGAGLARWWQHRETWMPRQRLLLPLLLLALGSVALHALVDFPLQIASIQLYVMVYLGVCWGSGRWSADRE